MANGFEDPVARSQIADHIKHCDARSVEVSNALERIEEGQGNIWSAISKGREVRFKMLISIVGFLLLLLVGLISFIWQSSPAGAQEMRCGTHADTMGYLKDSEGQTIVWEGWSLNGYHIRLYQNSSDNRWTTTVDRHVNIDYECVYSKGSAGSSSPINYDSET
jgi:hypothetical protein